MRHNELCDGVADLAGKDFTPSHVRDHPLISAGFNVNRLKVNTDRTKDTPVPDNMPPLDATEEKGELLIRDLWQIGTDSVTYMRVMKTDAKSHLAKTP